MEPVGAALSSWSLPVWPTMALVATAIVYARGWQALHEQMPERFVAARLVAFLGGLAAVFVAVASPLDAFAGLLLQVHMAQHLLLLMIAPPLLWLGAPALPLMRGLPQHLAKHGIGSLSRLAASAARVRALVHPVVSWMVFTVTLVAWHLPGPYQLALRSPGLASNRARRLPRRRPAVLVAGRAAVAEPAGVAALDDDSVSAARRPPEYRALRLLHVFRPHHLSDLRGRAAAVGHNAARRPGERRRAHVGAGVDRLPAAGGADHQSSC